jgi:apolipoprotein N-acyltransferase
MTVIQAPSRLPVLIASMTALTGWRRLLLAAFAGAIGTLAMPPVDFPPAMLIALPVLFLLARAARGFWHAFWAGVFWGTGHFITGLYWIVFAYLVPPADFALMGPPTVFGLAVLLALFVGTGCGLFRVLLARLPEMLAATWRQVLVFAVCFVIFEWLRGHAMTGFPWNQVGHAWSRSDAMSQSVAIFGIYGLSLLSLLVFTLPVAGRRGTAASLVLLAVMAGGGALRLALDKGGEQPGVQLRVVQPNIAQSEKWLSALANAHFGKTLGLSSLPAETPPTIVIWPETAIAFSLDRSPNAREAMARVSSRTRSGAARSNPGPGPALCGCRACRRSQFLFAMRSFSLAPSSIPRTDRNGYSISPTMPGSASQPGLTSIWLMPAFAPLKKVCRSFARRTPASRR